MNQELIKYISSQVDMDQVNLAIKRMNHERLPLHHADPSLYDEIVDLLEDYGEDLDLPEGWWITDDADPDDLIFQLQ